MKRKHGNQIQPNRVFKNTKKCFILECKIDHVLKLAFQNKTSIKLEKLYDEEKWSAKKWHLKNI